MNLDGLALSVLTRSLENDLLHGVIQRLIQIDKTTLVFKIHTQKKTVDFVVTVGNKPACYLSDKPLDIPNEPTSLCMFLRKYVEGARITSLTQIHGDRILRMTADKLNMDGTMSTNEIYIELMGKYSNCIFVQNGIILDALIHVTPFMNRERSIACKIPYALPPNAERGSLFEYNAEEILALLTTFKQDTFGQTIRAIFNGFGPQSLKELCHRAHHQEQESVESWSTTDWEAIVPALLSLREDIAHSHTLFQYTMPTGKIIHSPIELTYDASFPTYLTRTYASIYEALEEDVSQSGSISTLHRELDKLLQQAIQKETVRHEKIVAELSDSSHREQYKSYGDILMIYSYLPIPYQSEITVDNLLVDPPEPITIPLLQPSKSIIENAQHYYKLYTKLKNRLISGAMQEQQSLQRIDYLSSIQYSLSMATNKREVQEIRLECEQAGLLKKTKQPLSFKVQQDNCIKIPVPGGMLHIGRNNRQNEYLTHRWAKPNDLWFHTLQIQGSHVILRTEVEPSEETILLAARYAAYFSKARESAKVPVDYTYIKYIKKPPASPLGYVIYTNQNTVYVDPLAPTETNETTTA